MSRPSPSSTVGPDSPALQGEYFKRLATEAREGNTNSAYQLLDEFVAAVDEERTVHPLLLAYIAACLSQVLNGLDVDKALHVRKLARRPKKDDDLASTQMYTKDDRFFIAATLEQRLRKTGKGARLPDARLPSADLDFVAAQFGLSAKTVRRAYTDNRSVLQELSDKALCVQVEKEKKDKK